MNDRLRQLRLMKKMTQEELAEKMNVSRQSVAKWENGESVPDMIKCSELAKIFGLEIQDVAGVFIPELEPSYYHPKNKYLFGVSRITNGKIIIPEEALRIFNLKEGDELIVLGDTEQGIGLVSKKSYEEFFEKIGAFETLGGNEK